jgi:hypothetical protein
LLNPVSDPPAYWQSDKVSASATAANVRDALYWYYRNNFGTDISVVMTYFDNLNAETDDTTLIETVRYTITLLRLIDGYSASAASCSPVSTASQISVISPM